MRAGTGLRITCASAFGRDWGELLAPASFGLGDPLGDLRPRARNFVRAGRDGGRGPDVVAVAAEDPSIINTTLVIDALSLNRCDLLQSTHLGPYRLLGGWTSTGPGWARRRRESRRRRKGARKHALGLAPCPAFSTIDEVCDRS